MSRCKKGADALLSAKGIDVVDAKDFIVAGLLCGIAELGGW